MPVKWSVNHKNYTASRAISWRYSYAAIASYSWELIGAIRA